MPATNFALQNNFNSFNLGSMGGGQQYPPMQQPMMQQPMQQQQFNNSNMGMNPGMNQNPYGQGYWFCLSYHFHYLSIYSIGKDNLAIKGRIGMNKKVPPRGIEPRTLRSSVLRSPNWATKAIRTSYWKIVLQAYNSKLFDQIFIQSC